jgi:predicted ArsR family transcriptional regulator
MDHLAAVGDPELREALLFARSHARPVTADELSEAKGLHRNVARSRLERLLVEAGLLPSATNGALDAPGRAPAGRQDLRQSSRSSSRSRFPDQNESLAGLLVDALVARGGKRRSAKSASASGANSRRRYDCGPRKTSRRGSNACTPPSGASGIEASLEHADEHGAVIATPTCPLRPLVRARPEAVEIDRGMWAGLASCALEGVEVGEIRCETRDCFDDHASCKVVLELTKR